jgi:hypothetical protein
MKKRSQHSPPISSDSSDSSNEPEELNNKKVVMNDSDSDSDSDNKNKNKNKKQVKKQVPKKLVKIEKEEEEKKEEEKDNCPSIDYLLSIKAYTTLEGYIPQYKVINSNDVNKIIASHPTKNAGWYDIYDVELIQKLLKKIIERGYIMQKENYLVMLKQKGPRYYYEFYKKFNSEEILKNFSIKDDEIDEYCKFFKENKINHMIFDVTKLNQYDKKTLENIVCVLCSAGLWNEIELFINKINIQITEKYLKYAKTLAIKKHIYEIMTKEIKEAKKIDKNEMDLELLKCKNIEEIEDFINNHNYEITSRTIILACQNNIDVNILNHLLSYKINFDEDSVNEIIKSYRDNSNIEKMLLFMCQYGYQFKKSNYIEMFGSKWYYSIFHGNIISNFVFDDELLDYAYNSYLLYPDIFTTFLSNIEHLGNKNKINAEGIIALYCSIGDENKIKKLTKEYNLKLTSKCLKFLYKQKSNVCKKIIDLFKKDKVKPDFDVLKQYIDTFAKRREQVFLYELLEEQ